tara:strand:+ start:1313 stop:1564 length:252 start_codon:yes stop_codon:yes gene_type:complete
MAKNNTKHCPNCVTEMVQEKRKLGSLVMWNKCPSCGVREDILEDSTDFEETATQQLKKQQRDAYNGQSNEDYEIWLIQQEGLS